MLLVIHNLPVSTRYADVKSLLQTKCGLQHVILDNLTSEGNMKKVTVGVAEDADAAILVRKINGLYMNRQQLYVEDVRQQKTASEQPFRSAKPEPQQPDPPYNTMSQQNNSYNMLNATVQPYIAPVYHAPYQATDSYGSNYMEPAPVYEQKEKVQSAYPGISGYTQSATPQFSTYENPQDYSQTKKRRMDEPAASHFGRNYDQNRDWQHNNKRESPPRDKAGDNCQPYYQRASNEGPTQPDFRTSFRAEPDLKANAWPSQPDFRTSIRAEPDLKANAWPSQPDFRTSFRAEPDLKANAWPSQPDFRSTIRPNDRSDFALPALMDKPVRNFEPYQRRQNEQQGTSDDSNKRDPFSRRANDEISRRPNNEFSRRQNQDGVWTNNDEFSRRPNDQFSRRPNDEFSRKPNDAYSKRPNDEFSKGPIDKFSRKPNEEFSRRPNNEFSRRPNNEFARRDNKRAEFPRKPNVSDRSSDRQGTNQFSGRQSGSSERTGRPGRFDKPAFGSSSKLERNARHNVVPRQDSGRHESNSQPRSSGDSRKRTYDDFTSDNFTRPKPEPQPQTQMTEAAKEKLNKRMFRNGNNKILGDIYAKSGLGIPDQITRKAFRTFVEERMLTILGGRKMVTPLECLELYRAKYPTSEDTAAYNVVNEIVANEQKQDGNFKEWLKPAVSAVSDVAAAPVKHAYPKLKKMQIRDERVIKEAKLMIAQGKIPKFPLGCKSIVTENKREEKLGTLPEMDDVTKSAVAGEVDHLLHLFTQEFNNPPDVTTSEIQKTVPMDELLDEMNKILTQRLARRMTGLCLKVVRVYGSPKIPRREVLENFLSKYGAQSLRKSERAKMYTAAVDTFANYDKLCSTVVTLDGNTVTFKPFHVAAKKPIDLSNLNKTRKYMIRAMIDKSDLNLLDKDWPARKVDIEAREAEEREKLQLEAEIAATEKIIEETKKSEGKQEAGTPNKSTDYLNDDFHVIDEVNETDSDVECFGDVNEVFEINYGNGVVNNDGVNETDSDVECISNVHDFIEIDDGDADNRDYGTDVVAIDNGDADNRDNGTGVVAIGDGDADNRDNGTDVVAIGDGDADNRDNSNDVVNIDEGGADNRDNAVINDDNDKSTVENSLNANNDDDVNEYEENENILDEDGDYVMGDVIDNVDVDIDDLDDADLEDY